LGPAPLSLAVFAGFLMAMLVTAVAYASLTRYRSTAKLDGVVISAGTQAEAEFVAAAEIARCLAPGERVQLRALGTAPHLLADGVISSITSSLAATTPSAGFAAAPANRVTVTLDGSPPPASGTPLSAIVTVETRSLLAWLIAWRPGAGRRVSCAP
jgi:hypothetical protein